MKLFRQQNGFPFSMVQGDWKCCFVRFKHRMNFIPRWERQDSETHNLRRPRLYQLLVDGARNKNSFK
jgi:hypothetical protein